MSPLCRALRVLGATGGNSVRPPADTWAMDNAPHSNHPATWHRRLCRTGESLFVSGNLPVDTPRAVSSLARWQAANITQVLDCRWRVVRRSSRCCSRYNGAVGSWAGRLAPHINRLADRAALQGAGEITPIDETVRDLADNTIRIAG
jgi:hypothetical protein